MQKVPFNFFNYAGIHGRVRLYTTPVTYVDDITITTDMIGQKGRQMSLFAVKDIQN